MYDIASSESFNNCREWYSEILHHKLQQTETFCALLVGNKTDLESDRQVKDAQREVRIII